MNKYKILIVEDNADRIQWFKTKFCDRFDAYFAVDAEVGIELVRKQKFDFIFLDHDLGGRNHVDSIDLNTGYRVAAAILETDNKDTPCIIHSLNPIGAGNIKRILTHAYVVPFGTFDENIIGIRRTKD